MEMFTTGVEVDNIVFNQGRVKSAKSSTNNKIIFFPTYTTSKEIFQKLMG
jgi:hypothetical protein